MKKQIGNIVVEYELTPAEITAMQVEQAKADAQERHRPLTESEVMGMLLRQQVNALEVDDQTAYRMREFYPAWSDIIGQTAEKAGFKFTHNGNLYKTIPANHTFADYWVPGEGTESLYTRIDETHDGTLYDPISYEGNMALTAGLYYVQDGKVYLCNRDTVNPVHNALSELVGLFVEMV